MTARLRAATGIWRARQHRSIGDRAYIAYSLVLLSLIVVTPVLRAAWTAAATAASTTALSSPVAATAAGTVVLGLWAAALVTGTTRGPAVAPPFLAHALADSDLPRRTVFRSRMIAAVVIAVVVGGGVAVFFGSAIGSRGLVTPGAVLDVGIRGALIGVVTVACWLLGQAAPRVAGALAILALIAAAVEAGRRSTWPWAWVSTSTGVGPADLLLAVAAIAGLVLVPWLLDRISTETLAAQAAAWELAVAHAISMDFTAVAETYQARPSAGRRLRAVVGSARLWVVFVVRDLVGAVRMPARLVTGVVTLAASGLALVVATVVPTGGALLGMLAAILLFVGLGAFTRGLQHAAQVARDLALYGIEDGQLVALHTVLPTAAALVVAGGTAIVTGAVVAPASLPVLVWAGIALPLVVAGTKVSNALRGPSPVFLMTPAPSAIGDPMPFIRVLWALDAPILALLAGAAAPLGGRGAPAFVAVAVVVALFVTVRWTRRT
ncbi:DUF6297 family protein [Curtobacterium sp. ISL-83]|uniref:DUF6297 family protein n=1 Tax=Curtobacterium sp. ISL-83 TaxID=2819145 RepID=UPI001BE5E6D9|nr:DUF6297 family protein [Curtobacterium sp. ISL-83]MBT2501255.1 hypothetical protein [Curtobacterium sp. ISL-83]